MLKMLLDVGLKKEELFLSDVAPDDFLLLNIGYFTKRKKIRARKLPGLNGIKTRMRKPWDSCVFVHN